MPSASAAPDTELAAEATASGNEPSCEYQGDSLSIHELRDWLRLLETPGIGRLGARRLLAAFGSPEAIFSASLKERTARLPDDLQAGAARALDTPPEHLSALVEATWAWWHAEPGRHLVTLGDARYPQQLYELADPPLLLYAQGRVELLQGLSVAVVGSRNPSAQGLENARAFASALSNAGVTVVSGLALGIDGAAHDGALNGAPDISQPGSGSTIAVVGTGLDRVYPRQHHKLAQRIACAGLLLSDFKIGTAPLPANFPQRNRIIAGLTRGTLVVEAALKSGSLITARLASEAGRDVFAIPGSIHTPQARGCHALIKQGAKLVECTQDILEELHGLQGWVAPKPQATEAPARTASAAPIEPVSHAADRPSTPSSGDPASDEIGEPSDPVLQALGHEPASLEALQTRTGWSVTQLSVHLLSLELSGIVERLPGQLFLRISSA